MSDTNNNEEIDEQQSWILYDQHESKNLSDKFIKEKLGEYNFLGEIFNTESYRNFITAEHEDNELRSKGADFLKSNRKCKRCKEQKIQSMPHQTRAADESIPMKHTCLACGAIDIEY